tara:strand:- start:617 stop:907 length:291 start_codon:yes stop_codon:yes gene_type:complete
LKKPRVLICNGRDCRKAKLSRKKLEGILGDSVRPVAVRCQKICSGPVVGVQHNDQLTWFKKLKEKDVIALVQLMDQGKIPKRLRGKRVKKRAGKLR